MPMPELAGCWKKDKNGTQCFSVKTKEEVTLPAGTVITIYNNDRKTKDSQPDVRVVYFVPEDAVTKPQSGGDWAEPEVDDFF